MNTPIADFVSRYAGAEVSRLHMPGHKGRGPLGCEALDITEIQGADELYEAEGIIAKSEKNAAHLCGTGRTFYSTEGSSQCIRAMLFLALQMAPPTQGRPVLLAARNAHKALLYAAALLDFEIHGLWPAESQGANLCSCPVTPAQLETELDALAGEGKKPFVLSQDDVSYYEYMEGDGFASRLVVKNGEIKAEYVDASGQTLVGDYDLVPILETFIKEHPDFSYRGARAVLAVTGYEGIFGYRCNTSYISAVSQEYYDQEVAGAKEIVQALRDKGYTLACYTYNNATYGSYSVQQITADLQSWKQQIVPIIGDVDVFVFAKTSNISDYTGQAFQTMYNEGFRYFVAHGNEPWAEINKTYVRQNRLMVTGEYMAWYAQNFNGIFDPAAVLDLTTRGNIPKGA